MISKYKEIEMPPVGNNKVVMDCMLKVQNFIQNIHATEKNLDFLNPHVIDLAENGYIGEKFECF